MGRSFVANSLKKRNARRGASWVSTTGSSAMKSSARICLTSSALKNFVVKDLTSSKHCQPCDSSNTKKIQRITTSDKALPHLGGIGKNLYDIFHPSITATMDPALIDRGNLMDEDWANSWRYDSQN